MPAKRERGDDDIDLGLERLKELMKPGEVRISNAPDKSIALTSFWNAQLLVENLQKQGIYESVRFIDQAFSRNGETIPGYRSVVAKPKSIENNG